MGAALAPEAGPADTAVRARKSAGHHAARQLGAALAPEAGPADTAVRARKSESRRITRSPPQAGQATADAPCTSFSNSRSHARQVYS